MCGRRKLARTVAGLHRDARGAPQSPRAYWVPEDGECNREQKIKNENIVRIAHASSGEVFTSLQRPLPVRGAVVEPPKTPRSGIPKGRPTTTGTRRPWDSFDPGYRRRQRIAKVLGAAAARRGQGHGYASAWVWAEFPTGQSVSGGTTAAVELELDA